MSCLICNTHGPVIFKTKRFKTSMLIRRSNGVSYTAAIKRKREADLAKNGDIRRKSKDHGYGPESCCQQKLVM